MLIAYCPNSSNLKAPGDYRRFVGYCVLHNIEFKILNNSDLKGPSDGDFDFVVVTMASDLTFWANKFIKTKIIFECVDLCIFK